MIKRTAQEEYDDFVRLYDAITVNAARILKRAHEIDPIDGYKYLKLESVDSNEVKLDGGVYRYGEYEEFWFNIPLRAVFLKEVEQEFLNERKKLRDERIAEEQERVAARARQRLIDAEKHKQYLKDKAEFDEWKRRRDAGEL